MAGRWGSFLTGLESKLDTILADDDTTSKSKSDGAAPDKVERKPALAVPTAPNGRVDASARTPSMNRAQDRLNERLARAMANRPSKPGDSSTITSVVRSRAASPANAVVSPRTSFDSTKEDVLISKTGGVSEPSQTEVVESERHPELREQVENSVPSSAPSFASPERPSLDLHENPDAPKQSLDLARDAALADSSFSQTNGVRSGGDTKTSAEYQRTIVQVQSDYEAAELRRQEEMHEYLERIDALQSKLQYLTRDAAEVAKNASSSAEYGSTEQKLASKDEKIALLMDEGHRLSQTELKHMSIIKKLRTKSLEDDKKMVESDRAIENYERNIREAQERARRAEVAERRAIERAKSLPKLERDLEILREERDSKVSLIESLQKELHDVRKEALEVDSKAQGEALEAERKRTTDLADELSNVKMEKETAEKSHMTELRELREKIERDKERARVAAIERQGEQNARAILESRLEAFRARAEEASAGSTGDVQAKLLRQIETLQNQYAIASENWQGIESSLLARVGALEKERDDVSKREADVRRKARETNLRSRSVEEDFERATAKLQDLQHELTQQSARVISLHEKLSRSEAYAIEARKDLQAEREVWETRQAQRMEDDKVRQREELSRTPEGMHQHFRTDSPVTSSRNRKSSNPDRHSPHGRRFHGLAMSGVSTERPVSRRSSTQPYHSADIRPISRQDSNTFTQHSPVNGNVPETPSITVHDQDDFFDGVRTPASQENTINDVISASTGGAGPSVMLVERMSAAVRRLESEKAASKDELARLIQQRDEVRDQVVGLMREAEEKRKLDKRIQALEKENQGIQERYLTTLEMLGEKSENVEELKADVTDLKQMYRELVDSTMK